MLVMELQVLAELAFPAFYAKSSTNQSVIAGSILRGIVSARPHHGHS